MEEIFDKFEIGDRVIDSEGDIGTVSECDDPHNIFVRLDKNRGSVLYCVVKDCTDGYSDYGKLLIISKKSPV